MRPHPLALALLLGTAPWCSPTSSSAEPPPASPAPPPERWAGLRWPEAEARVAAIAATAGPLDVVAESIPLLVIALDDEVPSVRAAARERLLALVEGAVDPLLDALTDTRPGASQGAFATLAALGNRVLPYDVAYAAGGGLGKVQDIDRMEAALFLALHRLRPSGPATAAPWAPLRIASLMLGDPSPPVRRTAAAALALLGARHALGHPAAATRGPRRLVRLEERLRTRMANAVRAGSDARTSAACELAGLFGDGHETIVAALLQTLGHVHSRDAAALALVDVGAQGPELVAALTKVGGPGAWRALLRLGVDEQVRRALTSRELEVRRMALSACAAEGRLGHEAVLASEPEVRAALEDATLQDVRAALARLLPFGDEARGALPWLEAFVASEEAPPTSRDLVASFALRLDSALAWARARVDPWLAPTLAAPPAGLKPGDVPGFLAQMVAAGLEADRVLPDVAPGALSSIAEGPFALSIWNEPLAAHVARWLLRHPTNAGPWVELLGGLLPPPGAAGAGPNLAAPSLRDFVNLGQYAENALPGLVALHTFSTPALATPALRRRIEVLLTSPDPWLRHLAAQALRRP